MADTQQNFKIHMIGMSDHPVSQMYTRTVLPSWKKHGYEVGHFEAITPKDLYKKNKLIFGKKGKSRPFSLTEKAVWYSHFELWCECLRRQEPFLIIEHDAKLVKPLPDLSNVDYKFLAYHDKDYGDINLQGKIMAPGVGYYITPLIAQRFVSLAIALQPIKQNSDGHIASFTSWKREEKLKDFYYIEQINIDGLNTIDHKNPHKNYVGLNYEEIDIPSLHGQEI